MTTTKPRTPVQLVWAVFSLVGVFLGGGHVGAESPAAPVMRVAATANDFEVTGDGSAQAWKAASWTVLNRRDGGTHDYQTRVKMLYSKQGIYVLMDATDGRLTASFQKDFEDLWTEDVFEFFFWPHEKWPVYFEYEISPLGRELPIIIPNFGGQFFGWRPWHYDGQRRMRKAVSIQGGKQVSGAAIQGWRAEVFLPYDLLKPLRNVPPQPGSHWRANFYRVDYDEGKTTSWDWARVGDSFHDYQSFGTLIFQ